MNLKKAIKIIEEQKQKVLNSENSNNNEWIVETASYIKEYFGFESVEYSRIAQFKWHIKIDDICSDDEIKKLLSKKEKDIILFLNNCQSTLKNKGLYKPPKKNWFSDKGNDFIISAIIALIIFGFGIGYWTKEFELFSVIINKNDNKSLPISNSIHIKTEKNTCVVEKPYNESIAKLKF